jgi:cell division protein FtsI/penicillin-binding protein 2
MAIRDEIVWRSGVVYFAIALLAAALLIRILILQYIQRGKWEGMSEKYVFKTGEVQANRGDILTGDGRLLASSVPYYTIYMDTRSSGMSSVTSQMGSMDYQRDCHAYWVKGRQQDGKSLLQRHGEKATGISLSKGKLIMRHLRA